MDENNRLIPSSSINARWSDALQAGHPGIPSGWAWPAGWPPRGSRRSRGGNAGRRGRRGCRGRRSRCRARTSPRMQVGRAVLSRRKRDVLDDTERRRAHDYLLFRRHGVQAHAYIDTGGASGRERALDGRAQLVERSDVHAVGPQSVGHAAVGTIGEAVVGDTDRARGTDFLGVPGGPQAWLFRTITMTGTPARTMVWNSARLYPTAPSPVTRIVGFSPAASFAPTAVPSPTPTELR